MAATDRFIYLLLAFTLLFTLSLSSDPPQISPSPPPQLGSDDDQPSVPSPSPTAGSPPAPPPSSDLAPTPSSDTSSSSPPSLPPSPEAAVASDVSASNVKSEESEEASSSSGGMSSGKKVGIAFGVIGAACAVVFGGMLYRKRQYNIRRAEFSAAARTEFL